MVDYEKIIEVLEGLKIPYGDYGTDEERETNEAIDITIRLVKEKVN